MAEPNVPLPDQPMSGYVSYDGVDDVRANDQIEVRGTNGRSEHFYEVLSIREGDKPYVYDHKSEEFTLFTKEEMREVLDRDDSYKWTILVREVVPGAGSPTDSLLFYTYAVQNPELPEGGYAFYFGWALENENPVKNMPEWNGSTFDMGFRDLRGKALPGGELEDLYDEMGEDISELVGLTLTVAEFNARRLMEFKTEPTYDEEMKRRMERDSENIVDVAESQQNVYL